MTKPQKNAHKFALVEIEDLGREHKVWVENHHGFSIHIGDRVVVVNNRDVMHRGTVIRRSNVLNSNMVPLRIAYTANQFPVETDNQPELCDCAPVVRFKLTESSVDRITDAKSYLNNALEQLEKINYG